MWVELITFGILLVGQCGTYAGVTHLQQKGPTQLQHNASKLIAPVAQVNVSVISSGLDSHGPRVTMLLTKDEETKDFWITEHGELVKLVPVRKEELVSLQNQANPRNARNISPKSGLNLDSVLESIQKSKSQESAGVSSKSTSPESTLSSSSTRQQRTFWPFTSLFGYDYYYPPPLYTPPMFGPGPMVPPPPYGGFGMAYPPPPPGPYMGLEFSLGL